MHAKYRYEAKYQLLFNKRDIYRNIEECNPGNARKRLIVFYAMISDMLSNKKPNPIVTGLFLRGRKCCSLVFITQYYFAVPKILDQNRARYVIMKITNKQELQQIAFDQLSDINFMNLYKQFSVNPYFF